MSKEEMNLYKRCKNIFKAHGVDMGGGSGGGCTILGEISIEEEGVIGPEANASDLIERLEHGEVIAILMESPDLPGAMLRLDGNIWSRASSAQAEDVVMFPMPGAHGIIALNGTNWLTLG